MEKTKREKSKISKFKKKLGNFRNRKNEIFDFSQDLVIFWFFFLIFEKKWKSWDFWNFYIKKIKYIFLHDKTIFSNQIFKNALNYVSRVLDNYLEYIQTTRYHSASDSWHSWAKIYSESQDFRISSVWTVVPPPPPQKFWRRNSGERQRMSRAKSSVS